MKNLIGKTVKIVKNTSGHAIPIGTIGVIKTINANQHYINGHSSWFGINDFEITALTKKDIEEKIAELTQEISNLNTQKEFMEANSLEEFDENQYKVFKTLAIIEQKETTQLEKSKLIADLLN